VGRVFLFGESLLLPLCYHVFSSGASKFIISKWVKSLMLNSNKSYYLLVF